MEMEILAEKGSPQQRPTSSFPTNFSIPFSPKPRHAREPHLRPPPAAKAHHLRRRSEDTELSIFDAERYFKESSCLQQTEGGRRRRRKKALVSGPTAYSEPTWRSQLLSLSGSPAGSVAISAKASLNKQRRGVTSASSPWPLGGRCPCTRTKAVDVEERYSVPRSSKHIDFDGIGSVSLNKNRESKTAGEETTQTCVAAAAGSGHERTGAPMDHELGLAVEEMVKQRLVAECWIHGQDPFPHEKFQLALPFTVGIRTVAAPFGIPTCVNPPDDPSRLSLEVFLPAAETSPTPRGSADFRRLATRPAFHGDAGPSRRSSTFPVSPVARVVASVEDELASDSSSDLFEIESFSTQATPSRSAHPRGGSLDGRATKPRAAKTLASSLSSRVSRQPWRPADGGAESEGLRSCRCEEASPERWRQQNHAKNERVTASSARTPDGPPLLARSHGLVSPAPAGGACDRT